MRTKSWWSRTDNRLLEGGLALAILLVSLFGVLLPVLGVTGPFDPIHVREVAIDGTTQLAGPVTEGQVSLVGTRNADLVLDDPDALQRLLLALPEIVDSLLIVLILSLLLRMAHTLRDGDVFVPQNARRLRIIGVTALLLGYAVPLLTAATTDALVSGTPAAEEIPFSYTVSGLPVLAALLILALAEAFTRGAKLRADTEGLV
ncbi:DUF2975 domain-containing protein [Streptomyces sp. ISL-98]|uniref:DUF2975 domain-containing protein n=1 Tax=Streptomyces sp. ISL-98 TaxID=2819192 RepID=UPI001BE5658B|nr:DUF2975 domain-containing protein [Streptomyces sp. ISL-98]MBT2510845.1 DUF2975 domain-containing protein [Streptomyces sp. ISL-98]